MPSPPPPPPPTPTPAFQAHEVVYCSQCYLPYDVNVNITQIDIPKDAENRTWYLAKCKHALCSACLFPDGGNFPESLFLVLFSVV